MKRCTQCNHTEIDDALSFCRFDGTPLVRDSVSGSGRAGLASGSASELSEMETRSMTELLPNTPPGTVLLTNELPNTTIATTLLPSRTGTTSKLKSAPRRIIQIAALAIALALTLAGGIFYYLTRNNNTTIDSLAVLPFLNVNADQQLEYLSDGMTETLICNLSQLPKLTVKARASVFRYKGKDVSPRKVGADLNVRAILNGRVVQHGDILILSLELADARTENVIWSEQYNRRQTDLITMQNEIARDVSNKLQMKLSGADVRKLSKNYTANTKAYELYLKGRFYWNKRTVKDLEQSGDYFKQAIALDPNYAVAYAGLADTYAVLPFYRNESVREAMSPARDAALKALSLDGDLAEAHATLGQVATHDCDFARAEREYKRAIELKPKYATAHQWYGILLFYLARHEESLAELRWALEIDPLSVIINLDYAESLFYAHHYDQAIVQLKKTLELDPEFATAYQRLTKFYLAKGNYTEATQSYATYRELIGEQNSATLIRASFAKDGWPGVLQALTATDQLNKLSRYEKVVFLVALGDRDKAFAELDKSYGVFGPLLKIEPLLDPLRDDPRFIRILLRAGLT